MTTLYVAPRIEQAFLHLCKMSKSDFARTLESRYLLHGLSGLIEPDPSVYASANDFALDYAAASFLKKIQVSAVKADQSLAALKKFKEAELACSVANKRLEDCVNGPMECLLEKARRRVHKILGHFDAQAWLERVRVGPGSTFSLSGDRATWIDKLREKQITTTPRCAKYVRYDMQYDIHGLNARGIPAEGPCTELNSLSLVKGNRITTVPKTFKTDRTIGIEPSGNIMFQLGLGSLIRSRLKRFGVDLNTQSKNQYLASVAHKAQLATIDLSSASDTLCFELVKRLLPADWFFALCECRSDQYNLQDEWFMYEKFSAMGNGYTFELESLIFHALVVAVVSEDTDLSSTAIYGDDIILPRAFAPALIELLEYAGFSINKEKSFVSGRFFESCGAHFFDGFDVTPIYQKENFNEGNQAETYRMGNRIYDWVRRQYWHGPDSRYCYLAARELWHCAIAGARVSHFLPLKSIFKRSVYGSDWTSDYQDGGLCVARPPILRSRYAPYHRREIKVAVLQSFSRRKVVDDLAALAYSLRYEPLDPHSGYADIRARPFHRNRDKWLDAALVQL